MGMVLKLIINTRNYSDKEKESQGILPSKPFDYKRDILQSRHIFTEDKDLLTQYPRKIANSLKTY